MLSGVVNYRDSISENIIDMLFQIGGGQSHKRLFRYLWDKPRDLGGIDGLIERFL